MMKNKINFLIALITIIFFSVTFVSAISMSRSVASTAQASQTFQVTYTVSGATGQWGGSVEETITGGCTINGQTTLRFVMMSDLPNPLIYTATAPASGSCTFTGNYKFGTDAIVSFPSATTTIGNVCTPSCTCGSSTCIGSTCSDGCSGTCQGTKTCGNGDGECNDFFLETMNLYDFTDSPCTNGYIITAILGVIGLFVIIKLLQK